MSNKKSIICKDAYGKGLQAWFDGQRNAKFTVWCDIAETEKWEIGVFFRTYKEMPELEKKALDLCKGRVLDVGAGAGSHALYLQDKGLVVEALDISEGAVDVMKRRGIGNVIEGDFFTYAASEKYDTILMLMNGIGIVQKIDSLHLFFQRVKTLLNEGGRVIVDSSNILYMYEEEDGSAVIDLNGKYYGEVEYRMDYGKMRGERFNWLFIDYDTFAEYATRFGFVCEKVYEDDHYLYLAELRLV